MPLKTIIFGVVLILLGLAAYGLSDVKSFTALIPSLFGALFLLCGIIANLRESLRKHVMHVAAALSLIGALAGLGRSAAKIPALLAAQPVEPTTLAVLVQVIFGVLCLGFLILCVNSFIQARRSAGAQQS